MIYLRMNNIRHALTLAAMVTLLSAPAGCARTVEYSSGTGFYVHRDGYVLTSYHVIQKCKSYRLYDAAKSIEASLQHVDKDHDLALLKASSPASYSARFIDSVDRQEPGDRLTIIGYPDITWKTRRPVMRSAELIALKGPQGEGHLLQFSDAVSRGNSGGPLLNRFGNVVGVIMAKTTVTRRNALTHEVDTIRHADVAVRADRIIEFLDDAGVQTSAANVPVVLSDNVMLTHAEKFIVNVRCVVGTSK